MQSSTRGFSLIELMVTVAVLAIIASVAVPSFEGMRDRARVKAAAEAVYSHLQFSRTESIKQGRELAVSFVNGTGWCVGISNTAPCDCNTDGACQYGPVGSMSEHNLRVNDFSGITLESNQANVAFEPRRGTSNNAATVTLSGTGTHEAEVILSSRGRVRICGNVGGYPAC